MYLTLLLTILQKLNSITFKSEFQNKFSASGVLGSVNELNVSSLIDGIYVKLLKYTYQVGYLLPGKAAMRHKG